MTGGASDSQLGGLDGLRAVAALAVFGVHYNQIVHLEGRIGPVDVSQAFARGDHGVLLFFTLSGFLLSLPFWRGKAGGTGMPDLGIYALRRIARIVPAYYVALTILVMTSELWRFPGAWPDLALHYAFLFNYVEFSFFSINAPFWTLAVEMQFYLALPVLFLVLRRMTPGRAAAAILILCVLAYISHYALVNAVDRTVQWPLNPILVWIRPFGAVVTHSLLAHLPHFLFGVIAGWIFVRGQAAGDRQEIANEGLFWICLVLALVLTLTLLGELLRLPFGRYGFPLVPALVAVMVLTASRTRFARAILDSVPLKLAGIVSYGIYIYHVPCLDLVDRTMLQAGLDAPEYPMIFAAAGLALTLVAATLSYLIVERPILRLVRKYRATSRAADY